MPKLETLLGQLGLSGISAIELGPVPSVGPIWALKMPAERSFDRWYLAAQRARSLGYAALGIGDGASLNALKDHLSYVSEWDRSEVIQLALQLNLDDWFASRRAELEEDSGLPHGPWPHDATPARGFWFPFDSSGNHLDPWWMMLVPGHETWDAPVSVAYGNWNDCPPAHVHAALSRSWCARFGATLAAMGGDTIEFMVERPPVTVEQATALAVEHYLYCTDIVDQGCGTIESLAARLMKGTTWSFWWD